MKSSKPNLGTLGRILFAIPFGIIGLNHFFMVDFFSGMLTSFIPGGGFTILFTGFLLIAASVSIMFKRYVTLSCLLLSIMLLIFILTIHIPQLFDPSKVQVAFMQLLKDTALMGGAIMIAHIYQPEKDKD
jgi:uncharacterized membrane protein